MPPLQFEKFYLISAQPSGRNCIARFLRWLLGLQPQMMLEFPCGTVMATCVTLPIEMQVTDVVACTGTEFYAAGVKWDRCGNQECPKKGDIIQGVLTVNPTQSNLFRLIFSDDRSERDWRAIL